MPGKSWQSHELAELKRLRSIGMSVSAIAQHPDYLPGRTQDSISQQCRRKGWVDKELSQRCREATKLTDEQHATFIMFLRKHSLAPIEQLTLSWNLWAAKEQMPPVTASTVWYWIQKLRLPHSREVAWGSRFSSGKRRKRKQELFKDQCAQLDLRISLELEATKERARTLRKELQAQEIEFTNRKCGLCKQLWPLHEEFFSHLPSSFSFDGRLESEFQTEFCKFCDTTFVWRLQLYRRYGAEVEPLVALRKQQRRRGLDKAVATYVSRMKRKCKVECEQDSTIETRSCVRCSTHWPLCEDYFRPNRGTAEGKPTFRALCLFCDAYYLREIERAQRDGRGVSHLKKERAQYLAQAREEERRAKRINALKTKQSILLHRPNIVEKRCSHCRTLWPVCGDFWHMGHYKRKSGELVHYVVGSRCVFCKSDATAKVRNRRRDFEV